MKAIRAIGDKVLGYMVDGFGEKTTASGIVINERDGDSNSIRPRWFKVTHTGPDQDEVSVGEFVLVAHGRWSRGVKVDSDDDHKLYLLDNNEILLKTDTNPTE